MDVDVDINAILDLHRLNAQSFRGRRSINVFFSLTEPPEANVGDIWVADENYNDAVFSEEEPNDLKPNEVWQKIKNVEYEIDVDKISKFLQKENNKFYLSLDTGALIDGVSDGNVKLWDSVPLKAYAEVNNTSTPNSERLNTFQWDGTDWIQISFNAYWIYEEGTEHIPLNYSEGSDNDNYIHLNPRPNTGGSGSGGDVHDYVSSQDKIDITNFTSLLVEWEQNVRGTEFNSKVGLGNSNATSEDSLLVEESINSNFARRTTEVDISDISGELYVKIGVTATPKATQRVDADLKVYKVWLS